MRIWHNDSLVEELSLPATNAAWLFGDGAFETLRTYHSKPFALDKHLERLQKSLDHLHIKGPKFEKIIDAVDQVIAAEPAEPFGRVRITVFSDGNWLVTHSPYTPDTKALKICQYDRIKFSGYAIANTKSTSYAENFRALRIANLDGFDDVLFINEHEEVVESAMANLIWLRDGKWLTPKLESGCLSGVTRSLLIEHFDVNEGTLLAEEIPSCEALGLVSSLREIVSVERYESNLYPYSQSLVDLQSSFHAWVKAKLGL